MISKQKKQIYIGIIAFCIVASAVVIFISQKSPAPAEQTAVQPSPQTTAANQSAGLKIFPQSTEFDTSFFGSDTYKSLRPYTSVSVSKDEIGREDPFKPF